MAAGDPLISLDDYRSYTTTPDAQTNFDDVWTQIIALVSGMICEKCRTPFWSAAYTEYYDAPPSYELVLRHWPLQITGIVVKYAPNSAGDPSSFTSTTVLAQYTDWIVKESNSPNLTDRKRSAILQRIGNVWGCSWKYTVGRLAPSIISDPRAVQVTYTAGYDAIPYGVQQAALLATSKVFELRQRAITQTSEGLQGSSWSLASQGATLGVLEDPLILDMLRPYCDLYAPSPS